jgi:hypothetical protein
MTDGLDLLQNLFSNEDQDPRYLARKHGWKGKRLTVESNAPNSAGFNSYPQFTIPE